MRKFYFFPITILLATALSAQPTLTSNNLHTGFTFSVYSMSGISASDLTTSGANVSWDITGATATFVATVNFLEMSETPYAAAYPEANFAMKFTDNSGNINYSLFRLTESVFEEVANNVGTENTTSFLNYRTALIFPFTYNTASSDTYQKEGQETKNISNTYDSYGTFTTSGSTSHDVIRFNTDDNGNTSLNWWKSDPVVPVFQASNIAFVLWELTSTPTGILEAYSNELFEIYPNPATNELHILNKELISKIEIYNAMGQLQLTTTRSFIDISMLKSGVYILRAWAGNTRASQRFIKN